LPNFEADGCEITIAAFKVEPRVFVVWLNATYIDIGEMLLEIFCRHEESAVLGIQFISYLCFQWLIPFWTVIAPLPAPTLIAF
jgi:hypothetical protein